MEPYEKTELKQEITDEVQETLTRSTGKLITRRILLALAIIVFELFFWTLITTSVVSDSTVRQGLLTCFLACYPRGAQVWFIYMFKEQ